MICPKCGKEMTLGKLFIPSGYKTVGFPCWVEKEYLMQEAFPSGKDAEKKGVGISLSIASGGFDLTYQNMPESYACKECRMVLLDCNQ